MTIMRNLIFLCTLAVAVVAVPTDHFGRPFEDRKIVRKVNTVSDFNMGDLGVLKPQASPADSDFSAIMLDLLPEFSDVLKKFGGPQGAELSPTEMVSVFFPIVRKALTAKAESEGRTLTKDEERLLSLSETSIKLSTGVIGGLSVNDSASNIITNMMSIARPIMEANAKNQDRTLSQEENLQIGQLEVGVALTIQTMEDMTKDNSTAGIIASNLRLARYLMEFRARSENRKLSLEEKNSLDQVEDAINTSLNIMQDFNGTGSNVAEMVPTFMRLSRLLYAQRARNESRAVSWEEEQELMFAEKTLTNALGFIQNIVTGTASVASLNDFMMTTRKMFKQRALKEGRSTLDTDLENNLQITERALNLVLSFMKGDTPKPVQIHPIYFVHSQFLPISNAAQPYILPISSAAQPHILPISSAAQSHVLPISSARAPVFYTYRVQH